MIYRTVFEAIVRDPVPVREHPSEMRVALHGEKDDFPNAPEKFTLDLFCSAKISVAGAKIYRALLAAAIDEAK